MRTIRNSHVFRLLHVCIVFCEGCLYFSGPGSILPYLPVKNCRGSFSIYELYRRWEDIVGWFKSKKPYYWVKFFNKIENDGNELKIKLNRVVYWFMSAHHSKKTEQTKLVANIYIVWLSYPWVEWFTTERCVALQLVLQISCWVFGCVAISSHTDSRPESLTLSSQMLFRFLRWSQNRKHNFLWCMSKKDEMKAFNQCRILRRS